MHALRATRDPVAFVRCPIRSSMLREQMPGADGVLLTTFLDGEELYVGPSTWRHTLWNTVHRIHRLPGAERSVGTMRKGTHALHKTQTMVIATRANKIEGTVGQEQSNALLTIYKQQRTAIHSDRYRTNSRSK